MVIQPNNTCGKLVKIYTHFTSRGVYLFDFLLGREKVTSIERLFL